MSIFAENSPENKDGRLTAMEGVVLARECDVLRALLELRVGVKPEGGASLSHADPGKLPEGG